MNFLRHLFPKNSWVRKVWYFCKAFVANIIYRFPSRQLQVIGITGTDGKTSTVEMLSQVLREAGMNHLKISTVSFFLSGNETENSSKRTTLSPIHTQKLLRKAVQQGAKTAIIEISSHALEQWRVWGIVFDIAAITNVTEEHLDDHGGFAAYAAAKKKLFTQYLRPAGVAVLNADDATVQSWKNNISSAQKWISSLEDTADFPLKNLRTSAQGILFDIAEVKIELTVPGAFNMYNAAIAFAIAQELQISKEVIQAGLKKFRGVLGRLEKVDFGQNFEIYIDFAVTPNALEKALVSLKEHCQGHLWVVFGCTGDRDKSKRAKMGRIAGTLADMVVLTDDENYSESAELIREEVKEGITDTNIWNDGDDSPHFWEIGDRKTAISFALQNAAAGDVILIPGMGAENSRNVNGKEIPWNEKEIIAEIFASFQQGSTEQFLSK